MTNLPTVAVALFVKNEFSDIAGWIAWHQALGVGTFFIFDDHSTDGTWEIIQAAAAVCDVRAFRTDPMAEPNFRNRQRNAFLEAARLANGQYDWLGFLDADEYVSLRHHDGLPSFLASLQGADAVVLSSRIQGSSGHLVRPAVTAVEAFVQHAVPELSDNQLIRSFVRPTSLGPTYHGGRWFDVPAEQTVRPDGRPVRVVGSRQDVEWDVAFVMHYVCRSKEHYIARLKARAASELEFAEAYWKHFDRNDEIDTAPLSLMPRVRPILKNIYRAMVERAISILRTSTPRGEIEAGQVYPHEADSAVYRLKTFFGTYLYLDPSDRRIVHASHEVAQARGFWTVYGAVHESTPQVVTIFAETSGEPDVRYPLCIGDDARLSDVLIYTLRPDGERKYSLLNPRTGLYFTSIPVESGQTDYGNAVADRHEAHDWEKLELEAAEGVFYWKNWAPLPFLPNANTTADQIVVWLRGASVAPRVDEFLRVLASVPESVRAQIGRQVPGLLEPLA